MHICAYIDRYAYSHVCMYVYKYNYDKILCITIRVCMSMYIDVPSIHTCMVVYSYAYLSMSVCMDR